ncbi:putative hemagglutinin [Pseudomonas aeruginosa]|nr:putative hemagglutinin [Pseudomonas aeruginosa]
MDQQQRAASRTPEPGHRHLPPDGEGKLLAVQSFTGRGGDWSNDGLLASDGSLRLDLSGGYRGNGRATSLGDFA